MISAERAFAKVEGVRCLDMVAKLESAIGCSWSRFFVKTREQPQDNASLAVIGPLSLPDAIMCIFDFW